MATRSRNSAITIVLYYSAVTRLHPSISGQWKCFPAFYINCVKKENSATQFANIM